MCGRFTMTTPADVIAELFELSACPPLAPRYNIAPTQDVLAVIHEQPQGRRVFMSLHWGLIPRWAKHPTIGNRMIVNLRAGGYGGEMTVVNPKYDLVEDLPCVGTIDEMTDPPDLAILSVAAHRMEKIMTETIKAGARSAVVFDPCFHAGDSQPPLLQRLKDIAREADFPVCGGNGMG